MTNDRNSGHSGQVSTVRRVSISLPRLLLSALIGFISAAVVAFLGAYWGAKYAVSEQQTLHTKHAAALKEVIRFEAARNLNTLKKSTVNLRAIQTSLETYIEGDGPAPSARPGYLGLTTVGLRLQLESPSVSYLPPGLVGVYGHLHSRISGYRDVHRGLNAAAISYAAALTSAEQKRAAADLFIRIGQQLQVSEALVSQESGLLVFLACLDQFSEGADECEYKLNDTSDAPGVMRPFK